MESHYDDDDEENDDNDDTASQDKLFPHSAESFHGENYSNYCHSSGKACLSYVMTLKNQVSYSEFREQFLTLQPLSTLDMSRGREHQPAPFTFSVSKLWAHQGNL